MSFIAHSKLLSLPKELKCRNAALFQEKKSG